MPSLPSQGKRAAGSRGTLLLVMGIWGLNLPVLKWLTAHFDAEPLAALRMSAGAIVLACLLARRPFLLRLGAAQYLQLACAAVLMVYLYQLLMTEGIQRTTATNGALVNALHPLMASIVALALLGERLRGTRLLGAVLGLGGVAVVILNQPSAELDHARAGDFLMFGGLVLYCLGAVIAQRMLAQLDALVVSMVTQAFGAALLLAHALLVTWSTSGPPRANPAAWVWAVLFLSGAVSTGFSGLMWNRAVAAVGMARASVWLYWVPIFGVATAVIFLREPLTVWHIVGLLLVLAGTHLSTQRGS